MKILLTTLNSKFIHSNLALRYLKQVASTSPHDISIREFTINDPLENIIGEIYEEKADLIGFSCYIWNIEESLKLCSSLKKILPDTLILLGGPEVSYDATDLLERNPAIDYIIKGEGEHSFQLLLEHLYEGKARKDEIPGLVYREPDEILENEERGMMADLNEIPYPYQDGLADLNNKIIYYESSRGCPFQCQYCLSSTLKGVRHLPLDRVKKELKNFVDHGVKQVKLVDRTFNAQAARAREIFQYLISLGGNTNFHFEMAGHLIDQETLDILAKAPKGLFQFEIGIQSTNEKTLEEIKRGTNLKRIYDAVSQIREMGNIHLHLDLIAGLPEESALSFRNSFNEIYRLKPDRLQLGFLKLLKGSGLRVGAEHYGYRYHEYPPYEVLESKDISYRDLLNFKRVEDLLERYGNTHRYENSLDYLIGASFDTPFDLYQAFAEFWIGRQANRKALSISQQMDLFHEFGMQCPGVNPKIWRELLKYDYLLVEKQARFPEWMMHEEGEEIKEKIRRIYKESIEDYLPYLKSIHSKQHWRTTHIEWFPFDILSYLQEKRMVEEPILVLFDYKQRHKPQRIYFDE